jgi:hypothetical protein
MIYDFILQNKFMIFVISIIIIIIIIIIMVIIVDVITITITITILLLTTLLIVIIIRGGTEGGQAGPRAPPQDIFIFKKEVLYFLF